MIRLQNTTKHVDSVLCKDAGLSEPDTVKKCGGVECARWVAGEWTLCSQSHCQNRNVRKTSSLLLKDGSIKRNVSYI